MHLFHVFFSQISSNLNAHPYMHAAQTHTHSCTVYEHMYIWVVCCCCCVCVGISMLCLLYTAAAYRLVSAFRSLSYMVRSYDQRVCARVCEWMLEFISMGKLFMLQAFLCSYLFALNSSFQNGVHTLTMTAYIDTVDVVVGTSTVSSTARSSVNICF